MPIANNQTTIREAELPSLINAALTNNFGVSLYRLPGESEVNLVYGPCHEKGLDTLAHEQAFLIAPFDNEQTVLAIQPSEVFPVAETGSRDLPWHLREQQDDGLDKDQYKKIVRYGIEQIKAGSFDKVVATNKQIVNLPEGFEGLQYFNQLEQAYPEAFVYLTSTPQYGTWIGATPEMLLSFDEEAIHTEALAGTLYSDEQTSFSEKEQQEQDLVSRYIETCFENLAIDYEKSGPETIKSGKLNHLKTYYESHLNGAPAQTWPKLLKCLHPTPAVGGYPYSVTRIFIRNEEPFDRALYAGFLGPVNIQSSSTLFVNLRCMEVYTKAAGIYAGAGIVKGSQSEEEYAETREKMNTLLDVLQG